MGFENSWCWLAGSCEYIWTKDDVIPVNFLFQCTGMFVVSSQVLLEYTFLDCIGFGVLFLTASGWDMVRIVGNEPQPSASPRKNGKSSSPTGPGSVNCMRNKQNQRSASCSVPRVTGVRYHVVVLLLPIYQISFHLFSLGNSGLCAWQVHRHTLK